MVAEQPLSHWHVWDGKLGVGAAGLVQYGRNSSMDSRP